MSQVQDVIQRALWFLGVYQPGETMITDDSSLGQAVLNLLLDSLQAEKLAILGLTQPTVAMTGAASYAVTGATGQIIKIKSARVVQSNGAEQPVEIVPAEKWEAIRDKSRTGLFANFMFVDYGLATMTAFLTPKPSAGTLKLITYERLVTTVNLSDTVTWPPGYELAVMHLLGEQLAVPYGVPEAIYQRMVGLAAKAKNTIKQLQAEIIGQPEPPAAEPSARSTAGAPVAPANTPGGGN